MRASGILVDENEVLSAGVVLPTADAGLAVDVVCFFVGLVCAGGEPVKMRTSSNAATSERINLMSICPSMMVFGWAK